MRIRSIFPTLIVSLTLGATSVYAESTITPAELETTLATAQRAALDRDYDTAFELYSKAAHWGDKGAQYVLSNLYRQGAGTEKDMVASYAWLQAAAEAPIYAYRKELKKMKKNLSDSQLAQADTMAEELMADYGMEAAGIACQKVATTGSNIKQVKCSHRNLTVNGDIIVPGNA